MNLHLVARAGRPFGAPRAGQALRLLTGVRTTGLLCDGSLPHQGRAGPARGAARVGTIMRHGAIAGVNSAGRPG